MEQVGAAWASCSPKLSGKANMHTPKRLLHQTEVASTLGRLFDQAYLQNEARQQQARTEIAESGASASASPGQWGLGFASLEALAKLAGYPDLAAAFDQLVALEGLPAHTLEGSAQQSKSDMASG